MEKKNIIIMLGAVIIIISLIIGGSVLVINHSQNQITTKTEGEYPDNTTTVDNKDEITSNEEFNVRNKYKNGTFSTTGSYISPAGNESILVQITVSNDKVSSVEVTPLADDFESQRYQQRFSSGISSLVVGKLLDQAYINGRVNGSSLTGEGFNKAVDSIINQAKEV